MARTKDAAPAKRHPSHEVFAVEGEGDRTFWTRIGCAWPHGDGKGFNAQLSALPLAGSLVIRTRSEKEAGR